MTIGFLTPGFEHNFQLLKTSEIFHHKNELYTGGAISPNLPKSPLFFAENLRNLAKNFLRYRPPVQMGGGNIAECANIAECVNIAVIFWQKTFGDIGPPCI
jgi:hypothetical protein